MKKIFIIYFFALVFLSSCAGPYYKTNPATYEYKTLRTGKNIEYYTISNVLEKTGNKRYSKKEKKHNLSLVAVKIKNVSDSAIILSQENLNVQSGIIGYKLITPLEFFHKTKRLSAFYLIYGLVGLTYTTTEYSPYKYGPEFKKHFIPIGIPIAILNIIIAEVANSNYKKDLIKYSLLDKKLNPGEETNGFLYFDKSETVIQLNVK